MFLTPIAPSQKPIARFRSVRPDREAEANMKRRRRLVIRNVILAFVIAALIVALTEFMSRMF